MKIHLAIITKDDSELPKLKKAVASVRKHVDGVFVTSTGQDTDAIISYCKKNDIHHSYYKWDDNFGAVRNFNFEQAKDCDYILWIDSDDIFIGGEYLRDIAQTALDARKDLVFFTYWYGCAFNGEPSPETLVAVDMQHPRERLIRPEATSGKVDCTKLQCRTTVMSSIPM